MARPHLKFTEKEVRQLKRMASIGCSNEEISSMMECSWDTIDRNYADAIKAGRNLRNATLRHMQFKSALKGNVTMQIWLGKQYLGQKDIREEELPIRPDPERMDLLPLARKVALILYLANKRQEDEIPVYLDRSLPH